jgi:hypothetical protein
MAGSGCVQCCWAAATAKNAEVVLQQDCAQCKLVEAAASLFRICNASLPGCPSNIQFAKALYFALCCRRGVALNAAAGVTEKEWAAAVRLGHASAAAKAVLFDRKWQHKPSMALAAAAAAVAGDEQQQLQQHDPMQVDAQQGQLQQQELSEEADVEVVREVAAAAAAVSEQQQQQLQHDTDDDVVMLEELEPVNANGQPASLLQQQQQQQVQGGGRAPAAAAAAGQLSRKTRQVASEALAAVQAAAEMYPMQKGRSSRVIKR